MSRASQWRPLALVVGTCAAILCPTDARAQADLVPASIQAELLAKLETYDRSFDTRAGTTARVLIVTRAGNSKSELSAADFRAALSRVDRIGDLPHQEAVVPYGGAEVLAARCRSEHVAVIYLTPGFDDEVDALRAAFASTNVLTLGAVAEYVPRGVVLGFRLESGKPRILINLDQARAQGVSFPVDVLRLMDVYR